MEEIQEKELLSKFKIEISTGKKIVSSGKVLRKLFFNGEYQKQKTYDPATRSFKNRVLIEYAMSS